MAKLIYFTPASLGDFIDLVRPIGMYLYGRKTYETIAVWETPDVIPGLTEAPLRLFARRPC